jgi:hypothetical protein
VDYHEAKQDKGKRRYSLLVWSFISGIVDVLEFGAEKYAPNSWQGVPDGEIRYFDAIMRHLIDGANRDNDEESGLDPLLHAACNLMFLWWIKNSEPARFQRLPETIAKLSTEVKLPLIKWSEPQLKAEDIFREASALDCSKCDDVQRLNCTTFAVGNCTSYSI